VTANLSYDNLWQHEHSLGLQYGFSPESFKTADIAGFPRNTLDEPSVAYYSVFYRAPLSSQRPASDQVASEPTRFGYNEATRRFVLPPTTGRSELSLYATRSTTETSIFSPITTVIQSPLLRIDNQRAVTNVTRDYTVGSALSCPLLTSDGFLSSLNFGFDYKDHIGGTFPGNIFYTTTTLTNESGQVIGVSKDKTVVPGTAFEQRYTYFLTSVGWNGTWTNPRGTTRAGATFLFGQAGPDTSVQDFQNGALSTNATGSFGVARLRLNREQRLIGEWKLGVNAEGQAATQPLVSLEQFGIGGIGSVRGYQEGELYGDYGYYTQLELRTPTLTRRDRIDSTPIDLGATLSAFTDFGQIYLIDPQGRDREPSLWGAGIAASVFFGSHFEGRFAVAWPLLDSPSRPAGTTRVTFAISGQF
jgi:hemolysin activation/secretion protein